MDFQIQLKHELEDARQRTFNDTQFICEVQRVVNFIEEEIIKYIKRNSASDNTKVRFSYIPEFIPASKELFPRSIIYSPNFESKIENTIYNRSVPDHLRNDAKHDISYPKIAFIATPKFYNTLMKELTKAGIYLTESNPKRGYLIFTWKQILPNENDLLLKVEES